MVDDSTRNDIDTAVLVLSKEIAADGRPTAESALRLKRAVEELENHPGAPLITSGWGYRDDTDITLADAMADAAIRDHAVSDDRILRLRGSRDTVGDAVFLALAVRPRHLIVVTSAYHRERTERIFRFVLGSGVALEVIGVGEPADEDAKAAEATSFTAFEKTFAGIAPGDIPAIEERLRSAHPFYNGQIDVKAVRRHD